MMMTECAKFIYNDTPDFPFVLPKDKEFCLHTKKDIIEIMGYIFYGTFGLENKEYRIPDEKYFSDIVKYIGVYENFILQEVIYVDYENIVNTMNDLKPHMND